MSSIHHNAKYLKAMSPTNHLRVGRIHSRNRKKTENGIVDLAHIVWEDGTESGVDLVEDGFWKATKDEFLAARASAVQSQSVSGKPVVEEFAPVLDEEAVKRLNGEKPPRKGRGERKMSIMKVQREKYVQKVVDLEGKTKTYIDNGDVLSEQLRGKSLEEIYAFAAEKLRGSEIGSGKNKWTVVDEEGLRARYGHLNRGQQSMSLRVLLRKYPKEAAAS